MTLSRSKTVLTGPLILCTTAIEGQSESRFLGVIVDGNLTWARHIQTVQNKMTRYIGIMYKLKTVESQNYHLSQSYPISHKLLFTCLGIRGETSNRFTVF